MNLFETISRRVKLLGLILLSGPIFGAVQKVAAAVSCGDAITADTKLTADLSCECNLTASASAVTVVGPAKLNLDGNTITCTDPIPTGTACVLIEGEGATIKNGEVEGCEFGVVGFSVNNTVIKQVKASSTGIGIAFESSNDNKIVDVESVDNSFVGIFIIGNGNLVRDSYAARQPSHCIAVEGDGNIIKDSVFEDSFQNNCATIGAIIPGFGTLQNNVIKNNVFRRCRFAMQFSGDAGTINDNEVYGTRGIVIFDNDNVVKRNYFKDTIDDALRIFNASNTVIVDNVVQNATFGDGIAIVAGSHNVIADNVVDGVSFDGIDIRGSASHNTVKRNSVYGSGDSGIEVRGDDNLIKENWVFDSSNGIVMESSAGNNKLVRNEASGSTEFDLRDNSADCGTNNWKDNEGSGNIPCVEDD